MDRGVGAIKGAAAMPHARGELALVALAGDGVVRPGAVHAVLHEVAVVAVPGGIVVGAGALLQAEQELTLVAVSGRVEQRALAVALAIEELAAVATARHRVECTPALHFAVMGALSIVLVSLAVELAEPLCQVSSAVTLEVQQVKEVQLDLGDVAVDSDVRDHIHVAACRRLCEAVLDALDHEVVLRADADPLQRGRAHVGVAAQALEQLDHPDELPGAVGHDARAVHVRAVPHVVLRDLLRELVRRLLPHAHGALHVPVHVLAWIQANHAREARRELIKELDALHTGGIGEPCRQRLLRLHAALL
mmetsp:Transcript_100683/g.260022  ORF Transcript_100683/g.260022 Transcript_100683/m.260022 type:complete len:306 (+) Transcript_100683:141-1058(+)